MARLQAVRLASARGEGETAREQDSERVCSRGVSPEGSEGMEGESSPAKGERVARFRTGRLAFGHGGGSTGERVRVGSPAPGDSK